MGAQVALYTSQSQQGRETVVVDSARHFAAPLSPGGQFFYAGPSQSSAGGVV